MATTMKNLPADERPRERLLRHGAGVLADAEVLAVLLGTGTAGQPVLDLARELLKDGWVGLSRRSRQELLAVRGLGAAKTALLLAALEIGHRLRRQASGAQISGPDDVVDLLSDMRDLTQEEFRVLFLNAKNRVLGVEGIFRGGIDRVEVYPGEIFRRAVSYSAAAIIVAHNHPSGDPEPSREDRRLTRRLEDAGQLLGIPVLDHVIIGRSRHMSLKIGLLTESN